MTETTHSADTLVMAYRRIRDVKAEREAKYKEDMRELNDQLDEISSALLDICNTNDVESLRTKNGTVIRSARTRYWTNDWAHMYDFIKEHDAFFLLEQRINNNNMKQFLEDNPDELPMGLNADTKYTVTVRKPTGRGAQT